MFRLALFLDPRFRQAALGSSGSNLMSTFLEAAAKFGHSQGWDADKIRQLLQQLIDYSNSVQPFNLPVKLNSKSWWASVSKDTGGAVLSELAGVLLDVVPHAAGPERVFSQMGWYEGNRSVLLNSSTTRMKVTIKMHYDAVKQSKRK